MGTMRKNLTGQRFGRLVALEYVGSKWRCKCDCGNEKEVSTGDLTLNRVKSCGCIAKERSLPEINMKSKRIYTTYQRIKNVCYNVKNRDYKYTGGKGIKMCRKWKESFVNFYDWSMENGYKEDKHLYRLDVNKDYEPENCRWGNKSNYELVSIEELKQAEIEFENYLSKYSDLIVSNKYKLPIKGYEGLYEVDILGNVYSMSNKNTRQKGKLKPIKNPFGYYYVNLTDAKYKKKRISVHRIVLMTFMPNIDNKSEVNHIDGDKSNNRLSNLEWNTAKENTEHALRNNLIKCSTNRNVTILTEDEVKMIRQMYVKNSKEYGAIGLSKKLNLNIKRIYDVINRKTFKNVA